MTQYTRSSCYDAGMRRNALIVLACIVGVGVNCFLVFPALPQVIGGDNDFMGFYAASHLSGSDLYDHKAIVALIEIRKDRRDWWTLVAALVAAVASVVAAVASVVGLFPRH